MDQCAAWQLQHEPALPGQEGAVAESVQGGLSPDPLFPFVEPLYPSVYQPPPLS